MIYTLQASMYYQNIAKLLTHPIIIFLLYIKIFTENLSLGFWKMNMLKTCSWLSLVPIEKLGGYNSSDPSLLSEKKDVVNYINIYVYFLFINQVQALCCRKSLKFKKIGFISSYES